MDDLHDWASYLIQAEQAIKAINYKCLHNKYEGIEKDVQVVKDRLDKVLLWVTEHREQ